MFMTTKPIAVIPEISGASCHLSPWAEPLLRPERKRQSFRGGFAALLLFGVMAQSASAQKADAGHDSGEPAEIEVLGDSSCDTFQIGVKLFSDRGHVLKGAPDWLQGQSFIRSSLQGIDFRCTKAGVVTLLTPDPADPHAASLATTLESQGFNRVHEELFQLFGTSDIDRVRVYQKRLQPGEVYHLGRWSVLVGPKDAVQVQELPQAPDLKLVAPVANLSPGPEYDDSARMYQGIPGIERAANGRLWATWYGGGVTEDKNNYILLYTSGDDGTTWQRVLIVDPDRGGPVRPFDPCLWLDPDGKLWFFWAQEIAGDAARSSFTFAMTTTDPGSADAKWSEPRQICPGVMMNKPVVTTDGRWLFPVAKWFSTGSSRVVVSNDQGATFSDLGGGNIPDPKNRNADEHMVVERKDGSLWMLVRTTQGIGESVSSDGGKTWSDVKPASISNLVSRFFIRRLADGRLLLVRNNPPNGKDRSHLTAFLSDDDGHTWKGGLVIAERGGVSYPDAVQAPDGSIYVIYDNERERAKKILMAVVTEQDVLEGKPVSPNCRLDILVNQATGTNPTVSATPAKPAPITGNANTDGVTLEGGPCAGFEKSDVEEDILVPGAKAFLNRAYNASAIPDALRGLRFFRGSIDGIHVVCQKPGMAYVVTPSEGRNKDSRETDLLAAGFQKTNIPEFSFLGGEANLCSVFQKRMEVDEALDIGKWGIIVLPEKTE